jgi:HAD superfamily hydrolase (TIGR01549 family)
LVPIEIKARITGGPFGRRPETARMARTVPALLFDLDGTLVDSVYQHVGAWHEALSSAGIELSVWRIHRKIGMSGGLFVRGLMRELGRSLDPTVFDEVRRRHAAAYAARFDEVVALPGARELLATLTELGAPWAIATSGGRDVADRTLSLLDIPADVPVVTRDEVQHAKPDPDLFLRAAEKLGVPIATSMVVGDSVWDLLAARRAGALGVGVLSGGYGEEELQSAGAYRVYEDPRDLLAHLDEIGIRDPER